MMAPQCIPSLDTPVVAIALTPITPDRRTCARQRRGGFQRETRGAGNTNNTITAFLDLRRARARAWLCCAISLARAVTQKMVLWCYWCYPSEVKSANTGQKSRCYWRYCGEQQRRGVLKVIRTEAGTLLKCAAMQVPAKTARVLPEPAARGRCRAIPSSRRERCILKRVHTNRGSRRPLVVVRFPHEDARIPKIPRVPPHHLPGGNARRSHNEFPRRA